MAKARFYIFYDFPNKPDSGPPMYMPLAPRYILDSTRKCSTTDEAAKYFSLIYDVDVKELRPNIISEEEYLQIQREARQGLK